jgi:WXG100 family type VII secretion target
MIPDIVRADYPALENAARQFAEEERRIRTVLTSVEEQLRILRGGGWDADAASAFCGEMERDVCPGIARLATSLGQAAATTRAIARLFRQAEEEAAAFLGAADEAEEPLPLKEGNVLFREVANRFPPEQEPTPEPDPTPEPQPTPEPVPTPEPTPTPTPTAPPPTQEPPPPTEEPPPSSGNPADDILSGGLAMAGGISLVNPFPGPEDAVAGAVAFGTLVVAGIAGLIWILSQSNEQPMDSGQAGESAGQDGQAGAEAGAGAGANPAPTTAPLTGGQTYTSPDGTDWQVNDQKARQAGRRGWDEQDISDVIDNPADTGTAVDRSTGDPATVYYGEDGHYVVRNDVTGQVIQVSDRNDPNWVDDTDPSNPRPITPR